MDESAAQISKRREFSVSRNGKKYKIQRIKTEKTVSKLGLRE